MTFLTKFLPALLLCISAGYCQTDLVCESEMITHMAHGEVQEITNGRSV